MTPKSLELPIRSLTIDTVDAGGVALVIDPPLTLDVAPDTDAPGLLAVESAELGLSAAGATPDELADEVAAALAFLWREYALADPATLSPAARLLRGRLLLRLRER